MGAIELSRAPCVTFDFERHGRRGMEPGRAPSPSEVEHLPAWCARVLAIAADARDELPAFPRTASELLNLLEQADPEPRALVELIREDPAVSARVLRLANSAAFARGTELTTVHQATVRLGVRTVASVALAAATQALLDAQEREARDCFRARWRALSEASTRIAAAARWLSRTLHRGAAEEVYLAALMHDLGKAVALRTAGRMVQEGDLPVSLSAAALEHLLEATHVPLGIELTTAWDLPGYIEHVCEAHHAQAPEAAPVNEVLHLVRVASTLDEARTNPFAPPPTAQELIWSAASLCIEPEQLVRLADSLAEPGARPRL